MKALDLILFHKCSEEKTLSKKREKNGVIGLGREKNGSVLIIPPDYWLIDTKFQTLYWLS